MTGTLEFRLFASANSRPVYNYAAVTPYLSTCMQSRAGGIVFSLLYSITTTFGMKNQRKIAYGYWNTLAPDDANSSNVVIKLVPVTLSE
ncbi:hypothetical protein D917_02502 [Trichinella nativa]|uniref:Uncharacterized protein n=1 Tax=Trichinella nativa TaxID=6335 RepID=A0A1Y3EK12_9BILA|nr:hypothetical protein D917_02502 [Trichinella nativa]